MKNVEKEEIPSEFQGEDSPLDEFIGSYEDASKEHESCGVIDRRLDLCSSVYREQSVDPMGDIQDDESLMKIQHEQHMVEHESNEEDDVHNFHDETLGESHLEDHIEPMMEEDEQTPLGLVIDEDQIDVQIASRVGVFIGTCPQEVLESDKKKLQEIGGLEDRGVSYQTKGMEAHPYLGLPIDGVKIYVVATNKAATFLGSFPLQEYIDMACNTTCILFPIIGRGAGFLGQILLVDRAQHQGLSMDQYQSSRRIPCTCVHTLYW